MGLRDTGVARSNQAMMGSIIFGWVVNPDFNFRKKLNYASCGKGGLAASCTPLERPLVGTVPTVPTPRAFCITFRRPS